MLPTEGEMAAMRAVVQGVMASSAQIRRKTATDDGQGGITTVWAIVATVPCELVAKRGRGEATEADRTQSVFEWQARLPYGTDCRVQDQLLVDSKTYDVLDRDEGKSNALQLVMNCRRVD